MSVSDEQLAARIAKLNLKPGETLCFISHHKGGAKHAAVLFHDKICERLKLRENQVFLDSNDLHDLNDLLDEHLNKTRVVVLLQTKEVLFRPFVIAEIARALQLGIPVVPVNLVGDGYDFEKTKAYLSAPDFPNKLETENPGATRALEKFGLDVKATGKLLSDKLPGLVSRSYNGSEPLEVRNAMLSVILNDIVRVADGGKKGVVVSRDTIGEITSGVGGLKMEKKSGDEGVAIMNAWKTAKLKVGVLKGHTQYVISVVFSSDGKFAMTGSSDKTARLWNVTTGETMRVLEGHTGWVNSVAFSSDGKFALTGSGDKTARLWNLTTGETIRVLDGHTEGVWSVAFSSDGKFALTGSWDNTARLLNVTTGETMRVLEGHTSVVTSVAFSGDGKFALTGSADKTARLWNLTTGETTRLLKGHSEGVTSVAVSPEGKIAMTGSHDKTARLWNVATGETTRVLEGHTNSVTSVAFSSDGKFTLTGSWDNTARLWNVTTGETMRVLEGHIEGVMSVALSLDGKLALTGSNDNTARVWQLKM